MKKLLIVSCLITISGCAAISKNVVRGVNAYCNESYADRQLARSLINNALQESGHGVAVTCAGDPENQE